jgi:phage protein D
LELKYDGKDISRDVAPFVTSFKYVDRTLPDKMDEISVTFQDVPGLWRGSWFPERGAKFAAKINVDNWFAKGDHFERDCGMFEIDDLTSSGLPSTFTISAVSVGISSSIRRQQRSHAWGEGTGNAISIRDISDEIAKRHGFVLKWHSDYNPVLERWEQKSESDLSCLKKICEYAGLTIKITNQWIVIFNGEQFDKAEPEITIRMAGDGVKSYSFNANSSDVYSACEVKYFDSAENKFLEYLFVPDGVSGTRGGKKKEEKKQKMQMHVEGEKAGEEQTRIVKYVEIPQPKEGDEEEVADPEVGQVLKINQRVASQGIAKDLAQSKLRSANMRQLKGNLSLIGRPDLYSGLNVKIQGFGRWDGSVWSIEEVSHECSKSGYSSAIQMRGILGY